MPRYIKRSKNMRYLPEFDEETIIPDTMTVIEQGEDIEPTGLLSEDGQDICRVKEPIGFVHFPTDG